MLGFLVASMALFSLLSQSQAFAVYRASGYLSVFMCAAALSMIELSLSFGAALRLFFEPFTIQKAECALVALVAALGMTALTLLPAIGLQIKAANETGAHP
jgi:hypothetical protein